MAQRAQAAGAELRTGQAVTAITGSLADGFKLQTGRGSAITARVVIAAHGKRAALDRALGRRFLRRPQPYLALKAHFSGPPLPRRIDLHGFPGGYCGMSEIESGAGPRLANVCLLVHESVFQRVSRGKPDPIATFTDWMQKQNPRLEAWLSQARRVDDRWLSIAQVPFGPKRPVVSDVLMAGDSAGLIAPLAGDGIAMALRGGQMAAEHSLMLLAGSLSSTQLIRGYARAWQGEFGARLRLGRVLQPLMLRPRLLGPALRLLNAAPALARYLVTHTRAPSYGPVKETP
jgi:flavin-dependent dehydrogenase